MTDYFPLAIEFVLDPTRDGQPFHMTPNDPGGATAWGMIYTTWASWQRMHNLDSTLHAFKLQSKFDFSPIYRGLFWNACRCDALGPMGIQVFDAAVGSGPFHAAQFLQHVVGTTMDGNIGPATILAAQQADQERLNDAMFEEREEFYAKLPTAKYFERGWDRRALECHDLVARLLAGLPAAGMTMADLSPGARDELTGTESMA